MPRPAKNAAIETRAARARLRPSREPYWHTIRAGLALGARKPEAGPCTWIKRTRQGAVYSFDAFAVADDFASADGRAICRSPMRKPMCSSRIPNAPVTPSMTRWWPMSLRRSRWPRAGGIRCRETQRGARPRDARRHQAVAIDRR